MATSKDTRVRLLGRWKMSASDRPASGLPRLRPALAASARSRTSMISSVLRSAMLSRSRPASEALIQLIWLHRDGDHAPRRETTAIGCAGYTVPRVDIAVVVNGGVTETLQSTPLLRTLRAGFPTARISLLCPSSAADLA